MTITNLGVRCCSNCRYFQRADDDHPGGECRRHAPQLVVAAITPTMADAALPGGAWPDVKASDWCGEFAFCEA